eukprot:25959-Eustigmatos_ZCMA.PRE.1
MVKSLKLITANGTVLWLDETHGDLWNAVRYMGGHTLHLFVLCAWLWRTYLKEVERCGKQALYLNTSCEHIV